METAWLSVLRLPDLSRLPRLTRSAYRRAARPPTAAKGSGARPHLLEKSCRPGSICPCEGLTQPRRALASWAVDQGADVINLSLGGLPLLTQLGGLLGADGGFFAAIDYALDHDVLVVAAAGNDSLPLCSNQELLASGVLCVGAVDRGGLRSGYSNFGLGVQVVAPGGAGGMPCGDPRENVLSTVALDGVLPCKALTGYAALAGTSMATPHAAGVGALLAEVGVRGRDAANLIRATADDLGLPGSDLVYGSGRVNAKKALAEAR